MPIFPWDTDHIVERTYLIKWPGYPTLLIPGGYHADPSFIPDRREPEPLPCFPAHDSHDLGWEYKITASGVLIRQKGFWDQLCVDMMECSNRWLNRALSDSSLRGLRIFGGLVWTDAVKPIPDEWKCLFGESSTHLDLQATLPVVTLDIASGRMIMVNP